MSISEFIAMFLFGLWDYYVMISVINTSTIVSCLIYNYITGSTIGKDILLRIVAVRTNELGNVIGNVASQGQFGAVLANLVGMVSKAVEDVRSTSNETQIATRSIIPDDESDNIVALRLRTLDDVEITSTSEK